MVRSDAEGPIGVVLLNLGGPERLADVEPFLYNLFSDRRIIRLGPALLQKPIARLIARRRAAKSRESYRLIGGGSPLPAITADQAAALDRRLAEAGDFRVTMAMRYWQPRAAETLRSLRRAGVRKLIGLPLYPHYSAATSGSSLSDLRENAVSAGGFKIAEIRGWPTQSDYIAWLAGSIDMGLSAFGPDEPVEIVYSAHSLPRRFIDEGDPYVKEIEQTIAAVETVTGRKGRLCYQSRSGPVEWLAPSTPDLLAELAAAGCRNVLMVPISFVSDHVETLYEIDMLYRRQAETLGVRLERTAAANTEPLFIKALQELVLTAVRRQGWAG